MAKIVSLHIVHHIYFVRVVAKYFPTNVNNTESFISFHLTCSILVFRKTLDFYGLALSLTTLYTSSFRIVFLISFHRFLYKPSSTSKNSFVSSLPSSFLLLVSLNYLRLTMMLESDRVGVPCLSPLHTDKVSSSHQCVLC